MPVLEQPAGADFSPALQAGFSESTSASEPAAPSRRSRLPWLWLACLACGLGAVSLYPIFQRQPHPRGALAPSAPLSPLGLSVRPREGGLLLTWNPESKVVATAQRAILSITDGGRREDVDLYLPQFRTGGLVYQPVSEDVTLRLTVSSEGATDTVESVRVIGQRREAPSAGLALAARQPIPMEAPAPATPPTPRAFTPPTPARRSVSAPSISAPPPIDTPVTPEAGTFQTALGRVPQPLSPPPAPPSEVKPATPPATRAPLPAATQSASGPLRVSSVRILRRTAILYPPAARQAHVAGTVAVEVRIGEDGRVRQAEAIAGPEMLRWIAVKGVREWIFDPPVVDGKRVEAVTRVDVAFVP